MSLLHAPETCVAMGTGEAPLGMLGTLGSIPFAWMWYWLFFAVFPAFFVWMARDVFGVIDAAVTAMVVPTVTFSPTAHAFALIPMVFFILLAALISPTVRWRADLGQRAPCLNVQVKSVFDPISYGSSNFRDVLRFPPPRDRAGNLVEHTQYFSTMHTGLFLAEALLGSGAVPGARRWCAARSSWWLRLLGSVATTLLVGAPWWVGAFRLNLIVVL